MTQGAPLEPIADNPNAPIMTRIRNLSNLLKERDVVLQRAASEADEIMKTPAPPVKVPAHYAESKSVPITSGPIMPAKVQRPVSAQIRSPIITKNSLFLILCNQI
jgi:hypothetical protein